MTEFEVIIKEKVSSLQDSYQIYIREVVRRRIEGGIFPNIITELFY